MMRFRPVTATFVLIVGYSLAAVNDQVQSRQDSNPCNCYNRDSCGCVCLNPISWEQFQLLPQSFRPCTQGFTLAIRGGSFNSFPSDYFYPVGTVKDFVLDVSNSDFQFLLDAEGDASPFNGVTFRESAFLRFHNVYVSRAWNWGSFYDLKPEAPLSYCEIQVVYSTLPVIGSEFGRICRGAVTVVNVVSSGTAYMESGVFAPFWKLNEINLSGNKMTSFERHFFASPAFELETISLANNEIRVLPADAFSKMPSLQTVDLRQNPITTLGEETFRPIFNDVEILGIEGFPLTCDCRMRWLKEPLRTCGPNGIALAGALCSSPARLSGLSFCNDTLAKDLVC